MSQTAPDCEGDCLRIPHPGSGGKLSVSLKTAAFSVITKGTQGPTVGEKAETQGYR